MEDFPVLRRLTYVCPCLVGGAGLLAVALLCWAVFDALRTGNVFRAVGLVVLVVLAPLAHRYVPALLATDTGVSLEEQYSLRWLAIGSVFGAVVLLVTTYLHPAAPLVLFVASVIPIVLAAHFPTVGRADGETKLVVDGTGVPLESVRGYRTFTVGSAVVYWLSYVRGEPTAPRMVVVPLDCTTTVTELLNRPSAEADGAETVGRAVRMVALVFGLGSLAVGPVLWVVLPPGDGLVIALYAGTLFGLFGGLFLWYAYAA